jgi:uncharacterized protein
MDRPVCSTSLARLPNHASQGRYGAENGTRPQLNPKLKSFLKIWGVPIVVGLVLLWFAFRIMEPPPPKTIVFAAGSPSGAYYRTAEAYRERLAEYDVEVVVRETAGSVENIGLLMADEADVALVQGGIASGMDTESLRALGALFKEPLWVFMRADVQAGDLGDLTGARVAIGPEGSGTRALMDVVRNEYAEGWPDIASQPLGGADAREALKAGGVDAAAFVAGVDASYVRELLSDDAYELLPFERAEAIARRIPYLSASTLLHGVVDVGGDIPAEDVPLIATSAMLVVDEDTHPAIQSILLEAAHEINRGGTLMAPPGIYPSRDLVDLPLSKEATRYYDRGPSFLRRVFPFDWANFLERTWVLLIPLLTLMIPLVRIAPPLYRWRIRRKIWIWYRDLRDLEHKGRAAETAEARQEVLEELADIQAETGSIEVPLSYTDDLYRLRNHISFVYALLERQAEGHEA